MDNDNANASTLPASELGVALAQSGTWLVAAHLRPDGDATGSLVAGTLFLEHLGHKVFAYAPDGCPKGYEKLLDTVAWVRNIPEGVTHLLTVDCARVEALGLDLDQFAYIVNIDHHPTNPRYGATNWIDGQAAACAQMLWELATQTQLDLLANEDFQRACYAGLVSDTGRFRHTNTDARAMQVASDILGHGLSVVSMRDMFMPPIALALQKKIAQTILDAEVDLDGRLITSFLDTRGLTSDETDTLKGVTLGQLAGVEGVDALLVIRQADEKLLRCSIRCNTEAAWDVAAIAGMYGGGGHRAAAGFEVPLGDRTASEMVARIREEVAETIEKTYLADNS